MSRLSRSIPILVGAVAGAVIALIASSGGTTRSVTTTTVVRQGAGLPTSFSSQKGLTINQIYKAAGPGVVDITVSTTTQGFFGNQQSGGEGAGVVYDTKGDILTDEHVVSGA